MIGVSVGVPSEMLVVVSVSVTVPVGATMPVTGRTRAVKVTVCAKVLGLGDDDTVVVELDGSIASDSPTEVEPS